MSARRTASTRCYIEEYRLPNGALATRLREKGTGRKVSIAATHDAQKRHFLWFLSAVSSQFDDAQSPDSDVDYVLVSGEVDYDRSGEISYLYNDRLSYLVM